MDGKEILELRQSMGLSRERFARLVNVSSSSVKNWEKGQSHPTPLAEEKLEKLARDINRNR